MSALLNAALPTRSVVASLLVLITRVVIHLPASISFMKGGVRLINLSDFNTFLHFSLKLSLHIIKNNRLMRMLSSHLSH